MPTNPITIQGARATLVARERGREDKTTRIHSCGSELREE